MTKPSHILVIRLSALGDVAMTIPVLRVVAETYPEVKLTVISRVFYKPLFEGIQNLNFLEADVYGKHKGLGLLKLASEVKKLGVDAVADLHNVIRSKMLTKYLGLRGVQTATIDKGRNEKKALTRSGDKEFSALKTTHERYAEVFSALGLKIDLTTYRFPVKKDLDSKLNSLIGVSPKKIIGIAPFAAYKGKMYPPQLMEEVIKQLDTKNNYRIFLFGGGEDEIHKLKKTAAQFESVTSVAGELTFEEELALISNLDLMLSMDSGNGHLAAIYGIPTITLWGVTHPHAGFAPFMQAEENRLYADRQKYPLIPTSVYGNRYPEDYEQVMASISPQNVIEKILEIL